MNLFLYIILFTILGSIISLIGGVFLLFKQTFTLKISHLLASFAAGALLGAAFLDLLPEALEETKGIGKESFEVFIWVLFGILFFFILERGIHWFHHHQHNHESTLTKPLVSLIIVGDSIHNFIDGVAIAATFMVSIPLGITTAFAVGAHEIPQEIGDFGVLLKEGLRKRTVLLINFFSAVAALLGAILTFAIGGRIEGLALLFIPITAGFFIYIALSDLIPEIHHENRRGFALYETLSLLAGIAAIFIAVSIINSLNL